MPVLSRVAERFATERPLEGVKIAICLHVTAETANLVRALSGAGAEVALCSANPLSTQDDVAAALVENDRIEVHAIHGETLGQYREHVSALVAGRPQIAIDDGAELIEALHAGDDPPYRTSASNNRNNPDCFKACAGVMQ